MRLLLLPLLFLASFAEAQVTQVSPVSYVTGALASDLTGTSSTALISAPGAGVRLYVSSVIVTNNDSSVGTVVKLLCGSTTKVRAYAKEAGGGFVVTPPHPIRCARNEAFNIQAETTSAQIQATAFGYKAND